MEKVIYKKEPVTSSIKADMEGTVVAATTGSTQWIKIQKTFGPIHIERVGVGS